MPVIPFQGRRPVVGKNVFIAPDAWVIGDVVLEDEVSVFFHSVLRGDINAIRVGTGSNIQEGCLLHTSEGIGRCTIGANVTVGHGAVLHGCKVEDSCLIGMKSVILDEAVIGRHSLVGAQSLVKLKLQVPERTLVAGVPAKKIRQVSTDEIRYIEESAEHYRRTGREYRDFFCRSS